MLNDLETSLLRNLENRRARVLETQNAVVEKLREAVEHTRQCYEDPEMTQTRFASIVLHWHELLTLLGERTALAAQACVQLASQDLDPKVLEDHEPGGYIAQRLALLDAARTLSVRSHTHMEVIRQVMNDWFDLAGVELPAESEAN